MLYIYMVQRRQPHLPLPNGPGVSVGGAVGGRTVGLRAKESIYIYIHISHFLSS